MSLNLGWYHRLTYCYELQKKYFKNHFKVNLTKIDIVEYFYFAIFVKCSNVGHFLNVEHVLNSKNINSVHTIVKHVIWRIGIYNLCRKMLKFYENMGINRFKKVHKLKAT